MKQLHAISAVLFDLDGTLIDSESLTDRAVLDLLQTHSIAGDDLDLSQFHGVSWQGIDLMLRALFPKLGQAGNLAQALAAHCAQLAQCQPPPFIPDAQRAFLAASALFPTAIVTGSDAAAVENFLQRSGLQTACSFYVSNEQYAYSKPDPACYRLAADKLGIAPAACLVFEDSVPGLQAARAAGMQAIAVTHSTSSPPAGLAAGSIVDYTALAGDFFAHISA